MNTITQALTPSQPPQNAGKKGYELGKGQSDKDEKFVLPSDTSKDHKKQKSAIEDVKEPQIGAQPAQQNEQNTTELEDLPSLVDFLTAKPAPSSQTELESNISPAADVVEGLDYLTPDIETMKSQPEGHLILPAENAENPENIVQTQIQILKNSENGLSRQVLNAPANISEGTTHFESAQPAADILKSQASSKINDTDMGARQVPTDMTKDAKAQTEALKPQTQPPASNIRDAMMQNGQPQYNGQNSSQNNSGSGQFSHDDSLKDSISNIGKLDIDNIEVIDTKRFVAPTQVVTPQLSTNGTSVTQAIAQSAPLNTIDRIDMISSRQNAPKVINTLKIQLNPFELGAVNVVMRMAGEELQVQLMVETSDAYKQMSEDSSAIVKALRGQGYAVDQISVLHSASDRSNDRENEQSFQSYDQSGQMAQSEGQSRNQNDQNNAFTGASDMSGDMIDTPSSVTSDANLSNGVYL